MRLIFFGLPRSGSSWLGDVFGTHFNYFLEYFNHSACPVCKPDPNHKHRCPYRESHHEEIRDHFGSLVYWHALGQTTKDKHKSCIDKTWNTQEKWEVDKEVFSFSKIDAYRGFYDAAFTLYRSRLLTFPGSSDKKKTERCYQGIWNSLQLNKDRYESNVQRMLETPVDGLEDVQYASHAVASYLLLSNSMKEDLEIIEYQNLKRDLDRIPKEFHFETLEETINNTMKITPKNGFPKSEGVYEQVASLMEPEIRDIVMGGHKYFI